MAFNPRDDVQPAYSLTGSATAMLGEATASAFMAKVYRWMVGGLALTTGVALYVASDQALMASLMGWFRPLLILELVVVFGFSFLAPRLSGPVAALFFLGYSFLNGLTFSVLFLIYQLGSIASVFAVTALTFGALSVYATVTKKDLSAWRTFLFMGLIGVVLASVVNIFLGSSLLSFIVACAGVLVFSGLTAYDTQKLRKMHASSGYSSAGALAVTGALILYLDFINLFLSLLSLMGRRR
jgi:FtsH-binding integral membrane protein